MSDPHDIPRTYKIVPSIDTDGVYLSVFEFGPAQTQTSVRISPTRALRLAKTLIEHATEVLEREPTGDTDT